MRCSGLWRPLTGREMVEPASTEKIAPGLVCGWFEFLSFSICPHLCPQTIKGRAYPPLSELRVCKKWEPSGLAPRAAGLLTPPYPYRPSVLTVDYVAASSTRGKMGRELPAGRKPKRDPLPGVSVFYSVDAVNRKQSPCPVIASQNKRHSRPYRARTRTPPPPDFEWCKWCKWCSLIRRGFAGG